MGGDTVVRDPTTGEGAKVEHEMVWTHAMTHDLSLYEAIQNKRAYVMNIAASTLTTNWYLAAIKNQDDQDMVIACFYLWVLEDKLNEIIEVHTRGTFTYSANGTEVVPANTNSGGSLNASGEFYHNDGVGDLATITAGQIAGQFLVRETPTKFCIDGGWVIPKNQAWLLKHQLANDNTFRGWVAFYYHH